MFHKESVGLASNGYNVTLIVADGRGNEVIKGVTIIDVGKENSRFRRWTKTLLNIWKKAKEVDCDVYQFNDPELLFIGLLLKKTGKKVVWDMHENIPADLMQKKYIPYVLKVVITAIYSSLEKFVVRRIDAVMCTRQSVQDELLKHNKNIVILSNFPITNYKISIQKRDERIICFAGAIVRNYQHKEIIQAIEKIDNVKYLLAGQINEKYLNELKGLKGWKKVEYLGIIPFEEVKKMYSISSLGLAIHKYTANMDWQIGNYALTKIFELMLWELPVVCTNYTLWEEEIFSSYKCGITVNPKNVDEIEKAIRYLLDHPNEAAEMGRVGRSVVLESFSWEKEEEKLIGLYQNLLNE
jgi:glycosyltransferase involved in cell wall biosynthesis